MQRAPQLQCRHALMLTISYSLRLNAGWSASVVQHRLDNIFCCVVVYTQISFRFFLLLRATCIRHLFSIVDGWMDGWIFRLSTIYKLLKITAVSTNAFYCSMGSLLIQIN